MLEEFVTPGMLVFDIGANDGEFARRCVNNGARVIAVEPQRDHLHDLTTPGVTPVIAAVGASPGTVNLYLSHNTKWSSLHPEWVTGHKGKPEPDSCLVEMVTLDMLIGEFGQPNFLKIDTEGHEADVLLGLSYRIPLLSFEFHGPSYPVPLRRDPLEECLSLLPHYIFRAAHRETEWATDWITASEMLDAVRDLSWGDIYAKAVGP